MTPELEQKLYSKYPKIFRQKDLPMSQTCMCWGVCCGDGWYTILDSLCSRIQVHVDQNKLPQVEAAQVKEKFGTLRFYVDHADDYVYGLIAMAASLTANTCETCGNSGKLNTRGWYRTLCRTHAEAEGRVYDDEESFGEDTDE